MIVGKIIYVTSFTLHPRYPIKFSYILVLKFPFSGCKHVSYMSIMQSHLKLKSKHSWWAAKSTSEFRLFILHGIVLESIVLSASELLSSLRGGALQSRSHQSLCWRRWTEMKQKRKRRAVPPPRSGVTTFGFFSYQLCQSDIFSQMGFPAEAKRSEKQLSSVWSMLPCQLLTSTQIFGWA